MERIASRFKPNARTKNNTNIGRQHPSQKRKGQEKNEKEEQKFARKHFFRRERDIFSFSCLRLFIAMDSRSWSLLGRSSLEREPPLCAISSLFSFFLSLHVGGSIIIK
jgi:hypothetical protein